MQLHQLSSTTKNKAPRIGRGGKRGSYSGRGVKGQKSRAGHRMRPAIRDLVLRLPKIRGFRNKPTALKAIVLNVKDLDGLRKKSGGELVVSIESLKALGKVPMRYQGPVKILSEGEIDFAVKVSGVKVSESAKAKIEKAGGQVDD